MSWPRPDRFITLTQAPADWQRLRAKVRKLRMRLRNDGYTCHWAWTVELGKRTGMKHVHLLQHGVYVPQRLLQDRWGSRVDIRRIESPSGVAAYVSKEALRVSGYMQKNARLNLEQHLDNNGGRGCHLSRSYLLGKTSAEVWSLLHPPEPDVDWVVVPAGVELPAHLVLAPSQPDGRLPAPLRPTDVL